MPTTRETILQALHAQLQTQLAPVLRGEVLPERVSAAGRLILRDGDPGEPAVTLSPLRYHYQHRAEVEAVVQTGTGRDTVFDLLAAGVGIVLPGLRLHRSLLATDPAQVEVPRLRQAVLRDLGDDLRLPQDGLCRSARGPLHLDQLRQGYLGAPALPRPRLPVQDRLRPGAQAARGHGQGQRWRDPRRDGGDRRRVLRRARPSGEPERGPEGPPPCRQPGCRPPPGGGPAPAWRPYTALRGSPRGRWRRDRPRSVSCSGATCTPTRDRIETS